MKNLIFLLFIMILSTPLDSAAEIYKWVAPDGTVTFKATPPPESKNKTKVKKYDDSEFIAAPKPSGKQSVTGAGRKQITTVPVPPATAQQQPAQSERRFNGTVEIFVTNWCGYCKKAEQYMKDNGIAYVSHNIDSDSSAKQRFSSLGGRGVPLILIGNKKMSGFSPQVLEQHLKNP